VSSPAADIFPIYVMTTQLLQRLTEAEQQAVCGRHPWAALHTPPKGKQKQFYELHYRSRALCDDIHANLGFIPDWTGAASYDYEREKLSRALHQCQHRAERHTKQCLMAIKGTHFRERFYIVHFYKFDQSHILKMEVGIPLGHEKNYASNLEMASEALLLMEKIVPDSAVSRFPSDHHDCNFTLVRDFIIG
jgi:hypothetical protein